MTEASTGILRELAPAGRVRATINLGNVVLAQKDSGTGALGGVSVDLARELARRLGVEAELFPFDTAGKAFAALQAGACDVGFLAIDPVRAADLAFTAPYVVIEGTYLVPEASPLREAGDVDRDGVRVAAGKNTAYDLYLTRSLQHARLAYAPSSRWRRLPARLRGGHEGVGFRRGGARPERPGRGDGRSGRLRACFRRD